MNDRLAAALTPTLATVALVLATRQPIHAACLLVVAGIAFAVGPVFTLGANGQWLTLALAGLFGGALAALALPATPLPQTLGGLWCITATAVAMVALVRATFVRPTFGARLGFVLAVLVLLFVGQVRAHGYYLPLSVLTLAAGVAAMRLQDAGRPRWRLLDRRTWVTGAIVAASAVAFTAAMGWGLPRLHQALMVEFLQAFGDSAVSGFEDSMALDSLTSMLQSDEMVLRVYGRGVDRVRGAVYDRYDHRHWVSSRGPAHTIVRVGRGPTHQPGEVMVERVGGVRGWVMVPFDTASISTEEGTVRVDPLGVVRSIPGDPAVRVWFRPGARTALAPEPPTPEDLAIPHNLQARLGVLAQQFGRGGTTPFERLEHIEQVLRRRYRYSLTFSRNDRLDPVIDFLDRHPQGHCEYFASALALLGRASGVPTRVVGGYRVAERNPIGDYFVVREKNAHAWVEAWDGRAWQTLDATPDREVPQNVGHESRWWAALSDGAAVLAGKVKDWFEARTTEQRLGAALALLVGWLAWRTWRGRGESVAARVAAAQEGPLPCWDDLARALSARGMVRDPNETLERYAARVSTTDLLAPELRAEAAATVRAYAALRYGAEGSAEQMVRRTNEVLRSLR